MPVASAQTGVRIRRYRLSDAAAVFDAARESAAELAPWMPWCHPGYSIDDSCRWLEAQVPAFERGEAFEFAIVTETDRTLGGCGLNHLEAENRRANLGYWVRSSATRAGVATAAVHALRDWAFLTTDLIRLEIVVAIGNLASLRVAEKSGATSEGIQRSRLLLHGRAHDAVMYSLTRPVVG